MPLCRLETSEFAKNVFCRCFSLVFDAFSLSCILCILYYVYLYSYYIKYIYNIHIYIYVFIEETPPKWQENDLVSGGHGKAGSWHGQCTGWIGSAPVQISGCGLDGALS